MQDKRGAKLAWSDEPTTEPEPEGEEDAPESLDDEGIEAPWASWGQEADEDGISVRVQWVGRLVSDDRPQTLMASEAGAMTPPPGTPYDKKAAFREEALVHLDPLYGVALRLTKNERDAEDLVQDTVLKAYTHFGKYEQGTNCKAWLFKILTNTFINRYRKRSKEKVFLVDDREYRPLSERAVAPSSDPLHEITEDEQGWYRKLFSDDVKAALEEIPEDFRMVVLLADLYDFSYKETAEIMGCPIGTVMSRLYRGRRLLAARLADYALERGIISYDPRIEVENESGEVEKVIEFQRRRRKRA